MTDTHQPASGGGQSFFEIRPTAPKETSEEKYTDISLTNLLNLHANQINSIRQVIWQRYAAMLFANSVLFAFVGGIGTLDKPHFQRAFGSAAGFVLCLVWFRMRAIDADFLQLRIKAADRFRWTNYDDNANPYVAMAAQEFDIIGKKISRLAIYPIVIFLSLHSMVLSATVWPWIGPLLAGILSHLIRPMC